MISDPNVGADSIRVRMISSPIVGADSLDRAPMISNPNASQFGLEYSSRSVVLIPARFTLHKKELGSVCICQAGRLYSGLVAQKLIDPKYFSKNSHLENDSF